jgi:hypothetical protein
VGFSEGFGINHLEPDVITSIHCIVIGITESVRDHQFINMCKMFDVMKETVVPLSMAYWIHSRRTFEDKGSSLCKDLKNLIDVLKTNGLWMSVFRPFLLSGLSCIEKNNLKKFLSYLSV